MVVGRETDARTRLVVQLKHGDLFVCSGFVQPALVHMQLDEFAGGRGTGWFRTPRTGPGVSPLFAVPYKQLWQWIACSLLLGLVLPYLCLGKHNPWFCLGSGWFYCHAGIFFVKQA